MTNFSQIERDVFGAVWSGPAIIYLLCRPFYPYSRHRRANKKEEVEFIAKVTPDPMWSFQRWESADFIQFRENIGNHLFYQVEGIPLSVGETHVAFDTFLVHNVDGSKMAGFDLD